MRISDWSSDVCSSDLIKLGVQHYTTDKLTLRAGTAYLFTPVKDGYVTPDTPDSDAIVLSAGFGYKASPNWEINANMMYGNNQSRTGDLNSETGIPETYKSGTYKIHAFSDRKSTRLNSSH